MVVIKVVVVDYSYMVICNFDSFKCVDSVSLFEVLLPKVLLVK